MNVRIICVGKLREKFYTDAVSEFKKRLSRFVNLEIVELPDEKAGEQLSEAQRIRVKAEEGRRILEHLSPGEVLVATVIKGERLSSEKLADRLSGYMLEGKSRIAFAIGGSLGLSDEVQKRADMKLSFSDMTFTHQLFRVMLLEQIYRAFKIINGEPYHK